ARRSGSRSASSQPRSSRRSCCRASVRSAARKQAPSRRWHHHDTDLHASSTLALTSRSAFARSAAIGAQGFAILGVLVGLFTIAVGVGPRTGPDIGYHFAILAVLVAGFTFAVRAGD